MDVISLYGRKASAIRANDYIEDSGISAPRRFQGDLGKRGKAAGSEARDYGSVYNFGLSGYSPKKKGSSAKRRIFGLFGKSGRKTDNGAFRNSRNPYPKIVVPSTKGVKPAQRASAREEARPFSYERLAFWTFSLVIFLFVPIFVFNFSKNLIDSAASSGLYSIKDEVSYRQFPTADSDDLAAIEAQTLDSLFGSKLSDAEERFAFNTAEAEGEFDSEGNLIVEDGISIAADSVVFGEPVTYSTYTVKSGETIESITLKFGLRSISTLISANDITNVRRLQAKQKLTVPSQDGIIHKVRSGDSLNALSVRYRVSVEDILDANDLDTDVLSKDQKLFIPGAKLDSETLKDAMGETFKSPISARWRLTSHFGPRTDPISGVYSNHTGIDMACPQGTPIMAAMSGTVLKAGWSNIYGNYVIVKHPKGYQTLYGHMTKYVVKAGQLVDQGTRLGFVGSTGYSTGPHLHFTVYKNGKRVDPLPLIKK